MSLKTSLRNLPNINNQQLDNINNQQLGNTRQKQKNSSDVDLRGSNTKIIKTVIRIRTELNQ